jgi:hypothetical protein
LRHWEVIEDKGNNSLSISGMCEQLRIPTTYSNVSSQKITEIVAAHEIEQHLLQWVNNNAFL